jgi:PTH1 family peptidyl-tRNA hydrolase
MHVVCGLGNPGDRYEGTPHNVGFALVDLLAQRHGGRWTFPDPAYALSRARIAGQDVLLVKPQTWMNLSGDAVRALRADHDVAVSELLVVCDDIALPAGQIRLRRRGSDGGHNGLRSIIDALGSPRFPRLRLGVGAPPPGQDPADYVTERMSEEASRGAAAMVREGARCVEVWVDQGVDTAMNRFNRRPERADESPSGPGESV